MTWTTHTHSTPAALAGAVADRIAVAMDLALAERRQALLALAGGRTSPPVFRQLASAQRDWSRVTILPSDERWVAADHADNNLRQMREAFAGADGIHWLSLVPALPTGDADAGYANAALAEYPQAFDVAMLGMGADGHFASLFPGAPNLAAALQVPATVGADSVRDQGPSPTASAVKDAVAILPDPMPAAGPHPRVSLSLARLLRSRLLLLVITGADKRAVLEQARAQGDASMLPVAALLRAAHPAAEVHWSP
ncbi:MAG: 6-phosphogluconolactonase [Lysobacterales bacterium]|nr:6-phosphogluconolactonase [Xanthomonadales bacterium]MCB1612739.1 6-phosphogluconolactonase [Xanthomonadales bacterium]MCP5475584.1 6-phosphogluconolactonase [Rhodanobacteraceae bacterium]